jgi:hypothetical protein
MRSNCEQLAFNSNIIFRSDETFSLSPLRSSAAGVIRRNPVRRLTQRARRLGEVTKVLKALMGEGQRGTGQIRRHTSQCRAAASLGARPSPAGGTKRDRSDKKAYQPMSCSSIARRTNPPAASDEQSSLMLEISSDRCRRLWQNTQLRLQGNAHSHRGAPSNVSTHLQLEGATKQSLQPST